MPESLPEYLEKYFWDCAFQELDMRCHAVFIAERVLNFGNMQALKWLLSVVDRQFIEELVAHSRNLDKKTRNYWKLMLS